MAMILLGDVVAAVVGLGVEEGEEGDGIGEVLGTIKEVGVVLLATVFVILTVVMCVLVILVVEVTVVSPVLEGDVVLLALVLLE